MKSHSDRKEALVIACDCTEPTCATWLELTPDGILAIEDVDGQRLSIDLPVWLDTAMRSAMLIHIRVGDTNEKITSFESTDAS